MLIGGWNLSGIARFASGLPFSVYDEDGWVTNWEYSSNMVNTGPIKMRKHQDANGSEQTFDDPITARANMRDPYPERLGSGTSSAPTVTSMSTWACTKICT